jgi:O-succinylbenzoic acid--CoA ligase
VEEFARRLKEALSAGSTLILSDPAWPRDWKKKMAEIASGMATEGASVILIPTSGTTGLPKYCIHSADTLLCAAKGYAGRFGKKGIIHAVNVLPQHHVGGLMPFLRALECSGLVHSADYREVASIRSAPFPLDQASLSVVPTQLRRMLADQDSRKILRSFALILVGGAACPPDLLEQAREESLRLCPCYGSTETAAMVTALDPEEFLTGVNGVGTPLPHASVEVDADQRIRIRAGSITLGYLPETPDFSRDPFLSGDLGHIDEQGHLHIHGRADRVIITGGEKVHPEQVEMAALASGLVSQARCKGLPDPEWGQRVELEVVDQSGDPQLISKLSDSIATRIPRYAIPKSIIKLESLPPAK